MKRKINQKDYEFYVVGEKNGNYHIETGWEYRNDAKDALLERNEYSDVAGKIFTKKYLKSKGLDPANNNSWLIGLPKSECKFSLNNSNKMPTLGKTTAAGRAKKRVRKTASAAKKQITKRISSILKSTTKKLNKIVDKAAKKAKVAKPVRKIKVAKKSTKKTTKKATTKATGKATTRRRKMLKIKKAA